MKKAYIILSTLALVWSCSLEELPRTNVSREDIISNKDALETEVLGIYPDLRTIYQGNNMTEYVQGCSLLWGPYIGTDRNDEKYQSVRYYALYPSLENNSSLYRQCYNTIFRANTTLVDLADSPIDDERFLCALEGEVRLLRAITYFTGVRMWGDLPILTKPVDSYESAHIGRSSYLDVYKLIVDDLNFAWENMLTRDEVMAATGGAASRPDKWAAKALLAKVYQQMGSILAMDAEDADIFSSVPDFTACGVNDAADAWKKAYDTAVDVIENGPYALEPKFADLFSWNTPASFASRERIISFCNTNDAPGVAYAQYTLPDQIFGGAAVQNSNSVNGGRTRPTRFVFQKWAQTYGGIMNTNSGATPNLYTSCFDPRFAVTFIYGTYQTNAQAAEGKSTNIYPTYTAGCNKPSYRTDPETGVETSTAYSRNNFSPFLRKMLSPSYNVSSGDADLYYLRLAEMYLVAAEAAVEIGRDADAVEYINVLHRRARAGQPVAQPADWSNADFSTKTYMEKIQAIFWEGIFELYGEQHEFFESHRRGAMFFLETIVLPVRDFLAQAEQQAPEWKTKRELTWKAFRNHYSWDMYRVALPFDEEPGTVAKPKGHLLEGEFLPADYEGVRNGMLMGFPTDEIRINNAISESDQNKYCPGGRKI